MFLVASVRLAGKVLEATGEHFPWSLCDDVSTCPPDDGTPLLTDKPFTPETLKLKHSFFFVCFDDSVFLPLMHSVDEVSAAL